MNDFLLSLFLCSCFSFFFRFYFFFSKKKHQSFFEVSLFSSVFSSLLWNLSERTTVGDRNFIFLTLLPPPLFFFREKSRKKRERERERELLFSLRSRRRHEFYCYDYYCFEYSWFEDAKFFHARREKNRAKTRDIRQREQEY